MKAFWRFLTKPVISIADGMLMVTCTLAAEAMKLAWHLPWAAVMAIVWGTCVAAMFGIGFVKGFSRSALSDWRQWRAARKGRCRT